MQYLTKKNCKKLTNYTFDQIIGLTGIHGVHSAAELASNAVKYFQADIDGKIVNVEYETDLLEEFIIRIDLIEKTIKDEKFISTEVKKGISFPWLVSQVDAAVELGFKKISIDAYGGIRAENKYTGFIVWGRYGFVMSSAEDKREFKHAMISHGRAEKTLFELLHAPGGSDLWNTIGWDWLGEFNLSSNSLAMKNFRKVRKQKNL
ncbi:MAG: hypothetical protein KGO82_09575 [Bacteroidota bacterium]|nr:hypothetical protein [Bacteroidota bacterium]